MTGTSARILIVGAGIGGLAAAIAVRRAGFNVEVHERAPELGALGAGLTIQPNAVLALRRLGVGEALERAGSMLRVGGLLRWDGRAISELPRAMGESMVKEAGAPIIGIHRATLQELLLAALGRDVVQLDRACAGYEAHERGVRVHYASGASVDCDVLIGADGLRSAVRAQLVQDGDPVYAGYTSWRGVTSDRCGLPADAGGEMWGRGQRFGGCAIDGGRFYWFAVANAPAGGREPDAQATKAQLLERFAGWGNRTPELIASTPAEAILRTDIADRPPLARWGEGRVALLGDAAHPMTPNLGQGACQAIEDALVLGQELGRASSLEAGLRAYEAARLARANSVVVTSRKLGAVAQWQNPLACGLRNALFGSMPTALLKQQMLDAWRLPYSA
jgi:2-polyprenyl-6-methoxyphenol hydroxylase-like FAD-dependent oxidoreductase